MPAEPHTGACANEKLIENNFWLFNLISSALPSFFIKLNLDSFNLIPDFLQFGHLTCDIMDLTR